MDRARWTRIQELFHAARELPPAAQAAFLNEACGQDRELQTELSTLLDADHRGEEVDSLADNWLSPLADGPEMPSLIGQKVGPFQVIRHLGQGGMATVYLAERADGEFEQQVALKVLRRDHQDLVRRFHHERRILASLVHPHIARLLDGGTLDDGSPYLVMEYVDGEAIDIWADQHQGRVDLVVDLFLQICTAVEFAHRNLIIHRDLKPGNILVDQEGRVHLLDFGIAKLLADDAPEITRPFAVVLTPEYASPEQMQGGNITTATDVYTLGLVLYRLLSGKSAQPTSGDTDQELRRRVCEVDPLPASQICGEPSLARRLQGDLDTIVARALAKDPGRRYGTVAELAADLRRWREGRPVLARPDSWTYRAGKFFRRNRIAVAAALVTVIALMGGLGSTLWQAREAEKERDLARQAATRSDLVTRFMVQLFEAADPQLAEGDTLTARQVLDRGHRRIQDDLRNQPLVRAALLQAMGEAYLNLGLHPQADSLLHESHALVSGIGAVDSLKLAATLESLGRLSEAQGDWQQAAEHFARVLGMRQRLQPREFGLAAITWNNLGSAMLAGGQPDSALTCFEAALAGHEASSSASAGELSLVMTNLASLYSRQGQGDQAIGLFVRADSLMRGGGRSRANHPQRANMLSNWGVALYRLGDLEGAGSRITEALALWRRVLGENHPQVGRGENNLAAILEKQGKDEEAEPHYRESLRIKRMSLGARHPSVASTLNNLALLVQRRGDFDESEILLTESLAIREESLPADHPQIARGWYNLARLYHDTDRPTLAEPLYRQALELRQRVLGPENRETLDAAQSLAGLLRDLGRIPEAREIEEQYGLEVLES
jgi:serine/threonine-protein kinase|nr:serine/threonine-protein kinase [Candidatus Krumholzibacteria bacterium]